jgi:hypothetical protein
MKLLNARESVKYPLTDNLVSMWLLQDCGATADHREIALIIEDIRRLDTKGIPSVYPWPGRRAR